MHPEPYHPLLDAPLDSFAASHRVLAVHLHNTSQHTLAAIVSAELSADRRADAIALLEDRRMAEANAIIGLEPWHAQLIALTAIGPHFRGSNSSREFAVAMTALAPSRRDWQEQYRWLTRVQLALAWSTEPGAITVAQACHRDYYYDLRRQEIALMAPVFWTSHHPSVGGMLVKCMRGPVPHLSSTGVAAADTCSTWRYASAYLRTGTLSASQVFAPLTVGSLDVTQVLTPVEARNLAKHLGERAFDLAAAGHGRREVWALAVRQTSGGVPVGMMLIRHDEGVLRVGQILAPGGEAVELRVRAAGEAAITSLVLRGGVAAVSPAATQTPDHDTLQKRWHDLVGPYLDAPDGNHADCLPRTICHHDLAQIDATLELLHAKAVRL